jgi:poly-gamma-glutamate synthesis protein (capsule biosynthesis protein)
MHRHDPAYVIEIARRILGGPQAADQWLDHPSPQLGGRTPRDMLGSAAGARRVEELLIQLDDDGRLHRPGSEVPARQPGKVEASAPLPARAATEAGDITLFLSGDVMTGRGVDQIMPHPSRPQLYEPYMNSAVGYLELAESATGPIPRSVAPAYIWGDALAELERVKPNARIVNLETAVTAAEDAWPAKGIHYRMHPANVACLSAARLDCCTLANNHVLDWGYRGLSETLDTLHAEGIRTAGAGRDEAEAASPAQIELAHGRRVLVFAYGTESSGVPPEWAADKHRAGVNFLVDLSERAVTRVAEQVHRARRAGDLVVISIHWGGNWGYEVPKAQRIFAQRLVDVAGADVVHGHSSHHPRGIEIHRDRAILYGCGDFLNDYEGISGYEAFRGDLALMYFPSFDSTSGRLARLALTPMQIRHFRLNRAKRNDALWLEQVLDREGRKLGTVARLQPDHTILIEPG